MTSTAATITIAPNPATPPGARGGFELARRPERITLMDVVSAIEGPDEAFRCTEIRRDGAGSTAP
ncbi:Rrf2 family transcriptional regulator, partial [Nocardia cyriacigeorgica]|uniref:Rrf2 family transcriptional regulator n=1 Tax=Nocardia cyriacigeorgica TaxID=135487 RepID=UPI002458ABAF